MLAGLGERDCRNGIFLRVAQRPSQVRVARPEGEMLLTLVEKEAEVRPELLTLSRSLQKPSVRSPFFLIPPKSTAAAKVIL